MSNDTKRLKDICNKIIELNPKIRFAGVISPYGKTIAGKIKPGVKPLFKSEEAMNEFFLTAVREMLRKPFEDSLGKHILTLTMHEKVNSIAISSNKHILYITFEKDATFDEMLDVANKARELLS
ncbi:MAG: hypothetical protein KatS3mg003_0135 [Candidatus Nitrosocaldaceae archaeon]|nr:MAG: hypothetical protein KatS3mg003_0135 [Candidatus Nitrosocaldaceae archaeon]